MGVSLNTPIAKMSLGAVDWVFDQFLSECRVVRDRDFCGVKSSLTSFDVIDKFLIHGYPDRNRICVIIESHNANSLALYGLDCAQCCV